MAEKKGFLASLFGGGKCDCGMSIEDESADKKLAKKSGCCDMQIVEEEATSSGGTQAPKVPDTSGGCCGK